MKRCASRCPLGPPRACRCPGHPRSARHAAPADAQIRHVRPRPGLQRPRARHRRRRGSSRNWRGSGSGGAGGQHHAQRIPGARARRKLVLQSLSVVPALLAGLCFSWRTCTTEGEREERARSTREAHSTIVIGEVGVACTAHPPRDSLAVACASSQSPNGGSTARERARQEQCRGTKLLSHSLLAPCGAPTASLERPRPMKKSLRTLFCFSTLDSSMRPSSRFRQARSSVQRHWCGERG